MISKDTIINIYNEYDGDIYGISAINDYGYKFPRVNEYGNAVAIPVVFSDVQMINNRSSQIREGVLTFEVDMEADIYKQLNIYPDKDVNFLKKKDIMKIILNPTDENIEKVIKVTSKTTMERIKTMLTKMLNDNQYDIINIVIEYINARDWEIKQGIRTSALKVIKREIPAELMEDDKVKDKVEEKDNSEEIKIDLEDSDKEIKKASTRKEKVVTK